jgi:hypothetical protein
VKNLLLFCVLLVVAAVSAQHQPIARFKLGAKLGMSNVNMSGGRVSSPSKIALVGGIWCQLKLSKNWSVQAEAIYIEKGTGGYTRNHSAVNGSYRVAIMYLEVPVLFQYHKKNFWIEFGPGLGALTYQYEALPGAPIPNLTKAYPFTAKELSLNFGCGFALNENWYLGLRYTNSLLPVRHQIPGISKQVYNRVFSVTISRQLKFRKPKTKNEYIET